jgi:hypothetical protein
MPLAPETLVVDLEEIASGNNATYAIAAEKWAEAMQTYVAFIVPAATPLSIATAGVALEIELEVAFATEDAASAMETAFLNFATTVGSGMAPPFIATPPPNPVGFATLFAASPPPATHAEGAQDFTDAIDAWMKTGTAVPSGGGPPVFWS